MDRNEIINKLKELGLPFGSYVVFGSAPLALLSIRNAKDIDIFVSSAIFQELCESGWEKRTGSNGKTILFKGDFEVSDEWRFREYNANLIDLLLSADIIDGVPLVNIYELRRWKKVMNRSKDKRDVMKIDEYIQKINKPSSD